MHLSCSSLGFAGEAAGIDLRRVEDRETLEAIRAAMDRYAVLVFREQQFHRCRAARALRAHHSIAYSRQTLGFEFSKEEECMSPNRSHSPAAWAPAKLRANVVRCDEGSGGR